MASVFVVDIAEYAPLWNCAVGDSELEIRHVGRHVELRFPDGLTIDRAATGLRHALWYSGVAAVKDARVVQFDKTGLRVEAEGGRSVPAGSTNAAAPPAARDTK